jgi:hypothetical protein
MVGSTLNSQLSTLNFSMSLLLATLLPGILLVVAGSALLANSTRVVSMLKSFPRSTTAAAVFFGGGAAWFLYVVWHLSPADFGEYHVLLTVAFGLVAALSFKYVPDFLAVRGACVLVLLSASPLLESAYMEYQYPQRLCMVSLVYLGIILAIWLGAQPWRLRDFFEWLFRSGGRARTLGGGLLVYGLLLVVLAFTY